MNEFIAQFLIEGRELVTQATDDLLALEENPAQLDRLDGAFRAFHTLKGAAGIVDFDAMGRALHAAEDILSSVRAGDGEVTPQLISDSLTCLDQVAQWLDAMEGNGEIPAGADAQADAIVRRFSQSIEAPAAPGEENDAERDWLGALLANHPDAAVRAASALRFAPDPDSFLRGEDPLALLAGLPGLLVLEIAPTAGAWPALDAFDPFACQSVFTALSSRGPGEIRAYFPPAAGQVEARPLRGAGEAALPPAAHALIEAQILLLDDLDSEPSPGRAGSARAVAANVLRSLDRPVDAEILTGTELSGLAAALRTLLAGARLAAVSAQAAAPRASQEAAARALRVDVERIDALVNLAGELTIAKNALAHAALVAQEDGLDRGELSRILRDQHAQLARLVTELQRSVLNIRVLPMRQVFQRFPRLVREMVTTLGKPARLVTEGDDTEADKAIVENLFEPLLHVLRNALDHGVEAPEARAAAGKPPSATILLGARREGSHVVVEVIDDGAGVDIARVRAVAAERGVETSEALAAMGDADIANLVFAPGFSTATAVTHLSGRGVGMDAVRSAVERMGGQVVLASEPGVGTTVRLTLPFTVMMSAVMTVEAGGQVLGIPLEAMVETLRLPRSGVTAVGAAQAFVWRERTLPLIDLSEALGAHHGDERRVGDGDGDAQVVVTSALGQYAGLQVDRIGERMDVMLKPMEGLLAGMGGIAGTTLLGDGRVLLVLDLQALLQ
jgi:two-component system chemotaxis sensor kinase CheA